MATRDGNVETLRDLFEFDLQELYYVETELVDVLERLSEETTNDTIARGFADHREETVRHVERVEDAFDALGAEPRKRESAALKGLLEDKEQFDELAADDDIRNLHYVAAGMKTERMEITAYESLLALADKLDLDDGVTHPLQANLDDEEKTLKELKGLSEGSQLKSMLNRLL